MLEHEDMDLKELLSRIEALEKEANKNDTIIFKLRSRITHLEDQVRTLQQRKM